MASGAPAATRANQGRRGKDGRRAGPGHGRFAEVDGERACALVGADPAAQSRLGASPLKLSGKNAPSQSNWLLAGVRAAVARRCSACPQVRLSSSGTTANHVPQGAGKRLHSRNIMVPNVLAKLLRGPQPMAGGCDVALNPRPTSVRVELSPRPPLPRASCRHLGRSRWP